MINNLTPEQKAFLPRFRNEWFRWGVCTDRSDRSKAEAAILAMYAEIGAKKPLFVWCDSPATSLLALQVLEPKSWLRDSLGASLGASLDKKLIENLDKSFWGQYESYWIAFYLFARDVLGVEYETKRSRQLDMWRDLAQSCCWWWPYENYVVVSNRPTLVKMDVNERVHSETGPAIAFSDGWEVHAWHGTVIPKSWISERDSLEPVTALTWPNIEQRRVAAEIIGWQRVLDVVGARSIDRNEDPEIGELLESDLPDSPGSRFLKVKCATGRIFVLPVPNRVKTALEANAWTYGLSEKEYRPQVRT